MADQDVRTDFVDNLLNGSAGQQRKGVEDMPQRARRKAALATVKGQKILLIGCADSATESATRDLSPRLCTWKPAASSCSANEPTPRSAPPYRAGGTIEDSCRTTCG